MNRKISATITVALMLPLVTAAMAGAISGKVANPQKCSGVQALLREGEGVKYPCLPKIFPAAYDSKTGEFKAKNLPEGRYDLRLLVAGGRIDGVEMRLQEPDNEEAFSDEDEKNVAGLEITVPDPSKKNGKVAGSVKAQVEEFHKNKATERLN